MVSGLKNKGIDIWIDEHDIRFGDSIFKAISKGMDSADYLAFFMSKSSLSSKWSSSELDAMMSRRLSKRGGAVILPILLEDVEVPALLRDVMYLDLRDGDVAEAVDKLSTAIKHHNLNKKNKE